jgi:Bacterial Ig-like domain (group 3)
MVTNLLRLVAFICLIGSTTFAQAETWTGSNTGHPEWNLTLNWSGLTVPTSGAALTFPVTGQQKSNTKNNFSAGTVFGPIVLDGSGYSLSGNSINLQGGLSLTGTAATGTINLSLIVNSTQLITVQGSSSTLTMNGSLSGTGGITKTGDGTLVLVQNQRNTGAFRIDGGTLEVRGVIPSAVQIGNGYLSGTGSVGGIQSLNTPHAAISPGIGAETAIGTLTSKGNVTLSNTDAFFINLGYGEVDKLVVQGTCNLGGAQLYFSHLDGLYGLAAETDYVLIDNDGTDMVQLDADMGTWFIQNFQLDRINYQLSRVSGSNNNDLTIRRVFGTIPTTDLTVTPSSPAKVGDSVTLTATVKALKGLPTGKVAFYDGFTKLGEATMNSTSGSASFITNALLPGERQLSAVYDGSTNYSRSQSSIINYSVIGGTTTTTTLTVTPVGQTATLFAQVTAAAGTASGSVDFYDGAMWLGNVVLSGSASAPLTTPALVAGEHNFSAVYSTHLNFSGSSDSEIYTIPGITTAVVLTSSANPAQAGSEYTLTATVTGGSPTGTVLLCVEVGIRIICIGSSPLESGKATFTSKSNALGPNEFMVMYEGSFTHLPSTSPIFTQTIVEVSGGGGGGGGGSSSSSGGGGCGLGSGLATLLIGLLFLLSLRLRRV